MKLSSVHFLLQSKFPVCLMTKAKYHTVLYFNLDAWNGLWVNNWIGDTTKYLFSKARNSVWDIFYYYCSSFYFVPDNCEKVKILERKSIFKNLQTIRIKNVIHNSFVYYICVLFVLLSFFISFVLMLCCFFSYFLR